MRTIGNEWLAIGCILYISEILNTQVYLSAYHVILNTLEIKVEHSIFEPLKEERLVFVVGFPVLQTKKNRSLTMRSPLNISKKDFSFISEQMGGSSKDGVLKTFTLDDRKLFETEKTDDFSKSTVLQTPQTFQNSEQQESTLSVSAFDTPIGIREPLRQKRRRRRTTPQELAILEDEYLKDEKPNLLNRERIAAKINSIVSGEDKMGSREIQIWFQNKRQAMRRQTLHFVSSNDHAETVSGSQAIKKPCQWDMDNVRLRQHIEHKISSFKKIPSLRLCTNEGGKAQVMFNVLCDNKNTFSLYKKDDGRDSRCMSYYMGKENVPPDYEKSIKRDVGENEIEACARSLVGLAQGWARDTYDSHV
ncbi:hypothetical protein PNEG_03146 [Pneumocystis murina B123]|uniref:Homeobox domain-containing protein n=1 Tax=Pneumocystis murina (strain B123) TaxID=1069680 RepID=M7NIC0_PNEMU|nr:hypothetical protein PNEG_03146 [Pneumocystis murina B123]EMR08303.1 hypothetical protein PNEG_03146 [Pneumocystis murina B123]